MGPPQPRWRACPSPAPPARACRGWGPGARPAAAAGGVHAGPQARGEGGGEVGRGPGAHTREVWGALFSLGSNPAPRGSPPPAGALQADGDALSESRRAGAEGSGAGGGATASAGPSPLAPPGPGPGAGSSPWHNGP